MINQKNRFTKNEFSSVINKNVLNRILKKDIAERILKRILLSSTMKLFEIVRSEVDERFLNTFNNAIVSIFDIDDYTALVYVCIKIFNISHYKINNARSTFNELILIILELREMHEE